MSTYAQAVAGAGSTGAASTTVGTITMPANDGGKWLIHGVFGSIARATATAAESTGGYIQLSPPADDLDPNPAPSHFPLFGGASFLGATAPVTANPTVIYPVEYQAAGRATIDMNFINTIASTAAAQLVLGILFGDERPVMQPMQFVDSVRTTVTSASDTSVGTITLSERATEIVGVAAVLQQDGTLTTAEELIGFCRLASDDVKIIPFQFPVNTAFGAGLGATIGGMQQGEVKFIPVNIPVPKGASIDCFLDLNTAVTVGADIEIFLAYR